VEFTVKRYPTGVVSTAVHSLEEGDVLGLRGPYGNSYPLEAMHGKNVLIVGGGFAFTTLRSAIRFMLAKTNRPRFGSITAIYGARSPGELLYKDELKAWQAGSDIQMHVTVDKGSPGWTGREGFVPTVVTEVKPSARRRRGPGLRPPGHAEIHHQAAAGPGLRPRGDLYLPGTADELRHRQVRPLRHRRQIRLQRRPGLLLQAVAGVDGRPVLGRRRAQTLARVRPVAGPRRGEAKHRHLRPGGGYVFTPVHNIQFNVPPKNIAAAYEAAAEGL